VWGEEAFGDGLGFRILSRRKFMGALTGCNPASGLGGVSLAWAFIAEARLHHKKEGELSDRIYVILFWHPFVALGLF
jgi:hypothetical protein